MVDPYQIALLAFLVLLSGVFSGSETALVAVSRFKVRYYVQKGRRGSNYLQQLKDRPHRMLSTLLIGNNIVNVASATLATGIAFQLFESGAIAIAAGAMTLLLLIFGEIVPKNFANAHAGRFALIMAAPIWWMSILMWPLIWFFDVITTKVFRVTPRKQRITEDEIRNIVDIAREEGGIDKEEKEMIHRIFKFDDIDAGDIKTARTDMVTIERNKKLSDALELVRQEGHTRLPVIEDTADKVVGIFSYKEAIGHVKRKQFDTPVGKLMKKPLVVPSAMKIDELLKVFQKQGERMAIIVDEYGGVEGLITLENILEEIVGEIEDDIGDGEPSIVKKGHKVFSVKGWTHLFEVNERLKLHLPENEEYDTISGYIIAQLGRMPKRGDRVDAKGGMLTVGRVADNRIVDVDVRKK